MTISSRTPEGQPLRCPCCGGEIRIEPSQPTLDAPCPRCGQLLWFPRPAPLTAGDVRRAPAILSMLASWTFVVVAAIFCASMIGLVALSLSPLEAFVVVLIGILLFGKSIPKMLGWRR